MHRSIDTLAEHLVRALRAPLPGAEAQRRFAPQPELDGWSPDQTPASARRAAVLVLICPGHTGAAIPLTVRGTTLPTHGGQISLPGGAIAPGESVEAAALREAGEEIGVDPHTVRLLGTLSTLWVAVSNFVITPVVGVTREPPAFRLHEHEVEALIEMPVQQLLDRSSIRWAQRLRGAEPVAYPYFDVAGRAVWGATAMVLSEFACLIDPGHALVPPHGR